MKRLFTHFWRWLSPGQNLAIKREIDEELQFHVDMRAAANVGSGMPSENASQTARKQFGNFQSIREQCRDIRGASFGETTLRDVRFGFRMLMKSPGFTAVAVLTLALGIGASTAIFSFVNAILLRPLPYPDSERLVMVWENNLRNGWTMSSVAPPMLGEWRRQNTVFEGLAAGVWGANFTLTGRGEPQSIRGSTFSANIFSILRVRPVLGRDFLPQEEEFGNHHVVLLSHGFWQRQFGGDPQIIGQRLTLNAETYTIIGVMPPGTDFPNPGIELWTPLAFTQQRLAERNAHNYIVYGRLKPGVTLEQANAELAVISRRLEEADPANKGFGAFVLSLLEMKVSNWRATLLLLLGAVGFVLLIACANIANLVLARSVARTREFSIRVALGAGRGQVIRQLLTEGLLLAAVGGLGGVIVAYLGLKLLVQLSPANLPRISEGLQIDGMTLGFAALAIVVTGLVFGLFPALQLANPALARQMNESSRGSSAGLMRQRLRSGLVVAQVALSVMLLIGAGLMIRSFGQLLNQPLGFHTEQLVRVHLTVPLRKYPDIPARARFFEETLTRVKSLPGVRSATFVKGLPLSGDDENQGISIPGAPPPGPGEARSAGYAQVGPGYFRTMGIPLLQGRDFTEQDRADSQSVVIVDETFVKNFKLGDKVLGRQIKVTDSSEPSEIIGVVADVKRIGLASPSRGEIYRTFRQRCRPDMALLVQTDLDLDQIIGAIRAEVAAIDKDQPIQEVGTMTQLVASNIAPRKLSTSLVGGFAGAAMLLAALGLYGVLAYNVTQRTQEIGIRMALGARTRDVLALVVRHGMNLALVGIGVGVVGALILSRVMQGLLFKVEPTDPLTFGCVSLLLLGVALLSCWLPARRAARIDPMVALRYE